MKTLLSGFRPTVPAASSSRTAQMMKISLSSCHKETLILHLLHQQHCHLALQCQIQMYDGICEFCYPDSAYVDCTRWLLSPKTTSKIKRLFSGLPTLSQYNTPTLYDGSNIYKQCNPNKNINFVCRQSHFKIISASFHCCTSKNAIKITKTDIAILMHFHHSMSHGVL